MSCESREKKLVKSLKKEKLIELESGFVSSFKINKDAAEYNALQDKHAYHYFLNKPVKKHLKRLAKVFLKISSAQAISLEPLTTQNQKVLTSLNRMIVPNSTQNLSDRKLKDPFLSETNENSKKSAKELNKTNIKDSELSNNRLAAYKLYDPYTESLKTSSIQKIRKSKLESLKRKKYFIVNLSNGNFAKQNEISGEKPSKETQAQKKPERQRELSVHIQKRKNHLDKVQSGNQTKHLKLLNFINQKKNEVESKQKLHNQQEEYGNEEFDPE